MLPNILRPQKPFYFPHEFGNWGHYKCKILDEASIELNHFIRGYMHMDYGLDFLMIQ
jgi:hypothetical protein